MSSGDSNIDQVSSDVLAMLDELGQLRRQAGEHEQQVRLLERQKHDLILKDDAQRKLLKTLRYKLRHYMQLARTGGCTDEIDTVLEEAMQEAREVFPHEPDRPLRHLNME